MTQVFFLSLFQRSEEGKKTGYDGKLWNRTLRRLTLWKRSWMEPVNSTHSVECCSSFQERRGWFHRARCPSSGGKSRPIREKRRQLLQRKVLPDIMFKSSRKPSTVGLKGKGTKYQYELSITPRKRMMGVSPDYQFNWFAILYLICMFVTVYLGAVHLLPNRKFLVPRETPLM